MKQSLFITVFLLPLFFFNSCSGGSQIPPEVCNVGSMVCDVSANLCETIPQIPPEVCTYVNLACLNLAILCENQPGSGAYIEAHEQLVIINADLSRIIKTYKDSSNQVIK